VAHPSAVRASPTPAEYGPDQHRADPGPRDEFVDGGIGEQPAPADDHQMLRGDGHLAHQVAGDQHRTPVGGETLEQVAYPQHAIGIEAVDRFVEDQHRRIPEQRGGNTQPLAHAEGEPAGPPVRDRLQTHLAQHLVNPGVGDSMCLRQRPQVIPGCSSFVDGAGFEQGPDLGQRIAMVAVRPAVDGHAAAGGPVQADDHPHGGRLPSPVGAQESRDLARLDGEGQLVDRDLVAEPFAQCL
jgi:hypothetical protein